jgi:NAD(P)-dependent dehydrogenase (short-subunit alcohol dehydrogenase family)
MVDRVILITGSSGIAAATAELAVHSGDRVFVVGKIEKECSELCARLDHSAFHIADVSDEQAIEDAFAACLSQFGRLDAVFNVAGISGRSFGDGPLHECTTEAWRLLMDVHAAGTFFACREAIRHWLSAKQEGVILNTSSVLAHHPESAHFATHAYAASKGAVETMTIAAASYYAPHRIRLNVLAPGLVRTPMSARAQTNPEIQRFIHHKQPLQRGFIEPGDIAAVANFLLSNASTAITGEIVRADAGWAVTG